MPDEAATLREAEIRPIELMKGQAERFAADLARLLERRAEFVEVDCPACGASARAPEWKKHGLDYVTCRECETIYISPRPSPAVLEHYYSTSENYAYWNRHIFPASEEARRAKIFQPRAERLLAFCRQHAVATDTILEVGAAFGTFCEEIRKSARFRRILALEMTPDLAATCRKRGFEVLECPVEAVDPKSIRADVVASFEVLEHLFDPLAFVRKCHQILSPGGLLILTCPNGKGFDVMTLRELSSAVDNEHLNYFHPRSLTRLLERGGFKTLEVTTPGQLDAELVRNQVLAGAVDLSSQPFLRRVLVEEWERLGTPFQRFLAAEGLSSHMWIVARKEGT
jgi:SAM-dependent methyltransferase